MLQALSTQHKQEGRKRAAAEELAARAVAEREEMTGRLAEALAEVDELKRRRMALEVESEDALKRVATVAPRVLHPWPGPPAQSAACCSPEAPAAPRIPKRSPRSLEAGHGGPRSPPQPAPGYTLQVEKKLEGVRSELLAEQRERRAAEEREKLLAAGDGRRAELR